MHSSPNVVKKMGQVRRMHGRNAKSGNIWDRDNLKGRGEHRKIIIKSIS